MSNAFQLSSVMKTNNQVLNKIKEMGLLAGIALEVYEIISANPGRTVGEVYQLYVKKNPNTTRARNELAKRVNDLRNWGAIASTGTVVCGFSGRDASMWTVTGNLPVKTSTKEVTLKLPDNYNDNQLVAQPSAVVAIPDNDRELAIRVLNSLRFQSSVLGTMSRILFFVPGLRQKNLEVQKALQIAVVALRG